jgi:drug/metabolite transporter (DMT)-like permease
VKTEREKQAKAYLYALVAVLCWSTIASASKISLRHLQVLPLLFYATIVSTGFLFVYLLSSRRLPLLKTLSRTDYLRSALLGFFNPFLYYVILLKAYDILRAQEAMTINWTWPVTLVLLSIPLLHQRINIRSIFAIIISFSGVFVIATRGNVLQLDFTNPGGVVLALASTAIWALFWICNIRDAIDEAVRLFLNFLFGSIFILFCTLAFAEIEVPNAKGLFGAVYIGLFEMGIAFLAWLRALRLSKTTAHVANLIYLSPFLSLVVISLAVGEKISASTIIGLILIIGGIVLQKIWS